MTHRWSGWPGAWCLDCGVDCPTEPGPSVGPCKYPGRGLYDPYQETPLTAEDIVLKRQLVAAHKKGKAEALLAEWEVNDGQD